MGPNGRTYDGHSPGARGGVVGGGSFFLLPLPLVVVYTHTTWSVSRIGTALGGVAELSGPAETLIAESTTGGCFLAPAWGTTGRIRAVGLLFGLEAGSLRS